jgi:hypothetical protein
MSPYKQMYLIPSSVYNQLMNGKYSTVNPSMVERIVNEPGAKLTINQRPILNVTDKVPKELPLNIFNRDRDSDNTSISSEDNSEVGISNKSVQTSYPSTHSIGVEAQSQVDPVSLADDGVQASLHPTTSDTGVQVSPKTADFGAQTFLRPTTSSVGVQTSFHPSTSTIGTQSSFHPSTADVGVQATPVPTPMSNIGSQTIFSPPSSTSMGTQTSVAPIDLNVNDIESNLSTPQVNSSYGSLTANSSPTLSEKVRQITDTLTKKINSMNIGDRPSISNSSSISDISSLNNSRTIPRSSTPINGPRSPPSFYLPSDEQALPDDDINMESVAEPSFILPSQHGKIKGVQARRKSRAVSHSPLKKRNTSKKPTSLKISRKLKKRTTGQLAVHNTPELERNVEWIRGNMKRKTAELSPSSVKRKKVAKKKMPLLKKMVRVRDDRRSHSPLPSSSSFYLRDEFHPENREMPLPVSARDVEAPPPPPPPPTVVGKVHTPKKRRNSDRGEVELRKVKPARKTKKMGYGSLFLLF